MADLLWLFTLPFAGSLAAFLFPARFKAQLRPFAIIASLIPLLLLIDGNIHWIGKTVDLPWLPSLSVHFSLKMDALSLVFVLLTSLIVPASLLPAQARTFDSPQVFYGLVLFLEGLLIGFFTASDLVVFLIFWEAMLIPLYFIISLWGGNGKKIAALKFLIYMIVGSALMVAAVLALFLAAGDAFDFKTLAAVSEKAPYAPWILGIFLLAFAVKTPLFPFHGWLPDAYAQAPVGGTILLAGILSKAGIYGILRIAMEFFPNLTAAWSPFLLVFAIIGVFYGGLAAWLQNDYKRLIAYSSFSHVNFVLAGLFIVNETAKTGAILQAFNHGITITALFLAAGFLETRLMTTNIKAGGGLAKYMPHLCWLTLIFVLSSVALPGTNNFVGELMIFFGLFSYDPGLTAFFASSIILSVIYMLRWMQKLYFETPIAFQESFLDLTKKEFFKAAPFVLIILWLGIYPAPFIKQISEISKQTETETRT